MLVTAFITLALDLYTKHLAIVHLGPRPEEYIYFGRYRQVIPGFFDLTWAENTGGAFSFMHTKPWVIGLIAGLVALMTVLLIGFAPVAWVFSQSTDSLSAMGVLHLIFWVIATYFGLRFMCVGFAHLSGKAGGLRVWIVIFLLVMVQMTTALRPLIGTSDSFLQKEKKFFVKHWIEQLEKPAAALPAQR